MKGIIDKWWRDSYGFYINEGLINVLKKSISKAIDEIPDIDDEIGKVCNYEDRAMFRSGYKNGRNVFKSQLKKSLLESESTKSKVKMMWEVSKEQEEEFRKSLPEELNDSDTDDLFRLIRGTEYKRGKEDALKEVKK